MNWSALHIGLVGPLPPPSGGMANQTCQLAELLRAEGATVTLVQTNAPYSPEWVRGVRGLRAVFRLVPYVLRLWRAAGESQLLHVMANSGWSWHLFAAPAIWVGRLRHTPVVVNYRGGEAEAFLARSIQLIRPTLASAEALAVPSDFLRRVFAAHGIASSVLPNIIDTTRFSPGGRTAERSVSPHLVVARNLESIYDVGTAIRAFTRVRDRFPSAMLSIAGSGPELGALKRLTEKLCIAAAVRFTGRLERDEMAALYRSADLVLNPSRVDNMPNSILEALACGVPVVSTRVGGIPHMVQHRRTAILVEPGDDAAMADAAIRLIVEPEQAHALVRAGLAEVQRYTWSNVRSILARLYGQVLQARAARAQPT